MTDLTAYRYSTAVLPTKFTVCGIELKPFSLGHLMLLEHFQNPLVNSEVAEVKLQDAIYWFFHALLICALSYEDNLKVLNNDEQYKKLANKFLINLKANMDTEKGWNVFSKIKAFKNYTSYYLDMPLYSEERSSEGVASGVDWKQTLFHVFKKIGYKESEILNMSLKKLFYEWCSYAESEGAIKVMNKFDVEAINNFKNFKLCLE